MGYCICQIGADFCIESKNIGKALQLAKDYIIHHGDQYEKEVLDSNSITKVFSAMGFDLDIDSDGEVYFITLTNEKLRDQESFLRAIAPAVHTGSYIDLEGEDNYYWRWWFGGGQLYELEGEITFEDPPIITEED